MHGPSEVIDPEAFFWLDHAWQGGKWEEAVIYELHVGTFTPRGTFLAACERLDYLADLGITALELMPVADFPDSEIGVMTVSTLSLPTALMADPRISKS